MKDAFTTQRFNASSRKVIEQANKIIDEYQAQGFKLTLRQLFYQFVARDLLENSRVGYRQVCNVMAAARDAGEVDWDAIEDRTRELHEYGFDISPADTIETAAHRYYENLWEDQPYHVEVWIEKDALLGVIEGVCGEYAVTHLAHRGSNSLSVMYEAGERFSTKILLGKTPVVLHLTDHDPTGVDMHRDTVERLAKYARQDIEVRRLALTMEQVQEHNPPPSLVKKEDTRSKGYRKRFGTNECWELDALNPTLMSSLIREALEGLIDHKKWNAAKRHQERNKKLMESVAANWAKVEKLVARK